MKQRFRSSFLILVGMLSLLVSGNTLAAVRPEATRAILYISDKEGSVPVKNDSKDSTYLVQSWLEDLKGSDQNIPVVLTPPLFKLDPSKEARLRLLVMPGALPADRETAYWLVLQEIPPTPKAKSNKLVLAIRSRIKVFIRPAGLDGKAQDSVTKLLWREENGGGKRWLVAQNPTPYYVSFSMLTINGQSVVDKRPMVPPKGEMRYEIPANMANGPAQLNYTAINDFGGDSAIQHVSVSN